MGNVVDGRFISDQGNIFTVVEQNCTGNLEEMERAIISCDVLRLVSGTENEYEIRLNQMMSVFTKDPVKASEINDEDALVQDPLYIDAIWFAGGYVNMYVAFMVKEGSDQKHLINLVLEDGIDEEGTYTFSLRHNAFGDIPSAEDDDENSQYRLSGTYVSFPVSGLICEDSALFALNWKWYKSAGAGLTYEIEDQSLEYQWVRSTFEQAPRTLDLQSRAISLN